MANRKLIVEDDGTIKLVNVLKSGAISPNGQEVMTDAVIDAALEHMIVADNFAERRMAGYRIPNTSGGAGWLCFFDEDFFELKRKEGVKGEPMVEPIPKKKRGRKKKSEE